MNVVGALVATVVFFASASSSSAVQPALDGEWRSSGYGRLLSIHDETVDIFNVTSVGCVFRESISLSDFHARYNRLNRTRDEYFSYYNEGETTRYDHTRVEALPDDCVNSKRGGADRDPEVNFDAFWHSFNENYAFFDKHGVDWDDVYETYRPQIGSETTDSELYEIFIEIIDKLDDPHISLRGDNLPVFPVALERTLVDTLPNLRANTPEPSRSDFVETIMKTVEEEYLGDTHREAVRGRFTWGWAADGIGYFSIGSMSGFRDEEGKTLRDYLQLVDETMQQVIGDLSDAKGIIVDARWNTGGYDAVALQIAGYFTDQQLIAFTKRARHGREYSTAQEVFVPWHARQVFAGPVVYLSSRDTVSAAEIFSLAMQAIPTVTSAGEPTAGFLSDASSIYLPNRWRLRMSNEIYTAADGVVYEVDGVPVDVHVSPDLNGSLEDYVRLVMDAAIELLSTDRH